MPRGSGYIPKGKKPKRGKRSFKPYKGSIVRSVMGRNVHKFVRWTPIEPISILSCNFGVTGTSATALRFQLNFVNNATEFTTLYDSYMITGVKVYFDYSPDALAPGTGSWQDPSMYPKLWIKRDYDDSAVPSLAEVADSNQSRCIRFNAVKNTFSMFIRPAVATTLGLTNAQASLGTYSSWNKWIDCANPSVDHYGLKLIAQGVPSADMGKITIRMKYYLKFKNVR